MFGLFNYSKSKDTTDRKDTIPDGYWERFGVHVHYSLQPPWFYRKREGIGEQEAHHQVGLGETRAA